MLLALVLAVLSFVAGADARQVNASIASACWHEDRDVSGGIGLLSLRVRKAASPPTPSSTELLKAWELLERSSHSHPNILLLDSTFAVLGFAALHVLLHAYFKDTSDGSQHKDAKPRLDLLDNAKFWMMVLICSQHIPGGPTSPLIHFHTRAFAFVSGWVTRNRRPDRRGVQSFLGHQVASLLLFVSFLGPVAKYLDPETPEGFPKSVAAYLALIYNDLKYPFHNTGTHIWYAQALIFWQLCGFLFVSFQPTSKILDRGLVNIFCVSESLSS